MGPASFRKCYTLWLCIVGRMLVLNPGGCGLVPRIYCCWWIWVLSDLPVGGTASCFSPGESPHLHFQARGSGNDALTPEARGRHVTQGRPIRTLPSLASTPSNSLRGGHMTQGRPIRTMRSLPATPSNSFRAKQLSLTRQWYSILDRAIDRHALSTGTVYYTGFILILDKGGAINLKTFTSIC